MTAAIPAAKRTFRDERRAQLLDAAAELVLAGGVDAVTMERLAGAIGVNKTIVYRAYPNRSAVLVALFDRATAATGQQIVDAATQARSLEEVLRVAVRIWLDAVTASNGLLPRLLEAGHGDLDLGARQLQWHRDSVRAWALAVAAAPGVAEEDAVDVAAILLAGLQGAIGRWLVDGRPRDAVEDRYVRIALAAVADLQR